MVTVVPGQGGRFQSAASPNRGVGAGGGRGPGPLRLLAVPPLGRKTSDLRRASPGLSVCIHVSPFRADASPLVRSHPEGRIRTWSSVMLEQRPPEKVPFEALRVRSGGVVAGAVTQQPPRRAFLRRDSLRVGGRGGRARGGGRPGGP